MTSTWASQSSHSVIDLLLDAHESIPFGRDADMLFVIQAGPVRAGFFDSESPAALLGVNDARHRRVAESIPDAGSGRR